MSYIGLPGNSHLGYIGRHTLKDQKRINYHMTVTMVTLSGTKCQILSAVQGSLLCRMGFLKHYFVMLTLDDITFKAISVAVQNPDAVNNSLLCYSVGFPRSHSSAVSPVTMAILCCYDRNRYTQKSTTSNGTGWLFVNQFTF